MKKIRALLLLLASIGLCHGQNATSRKISFRCLSLGVKDKLTEAVIVGGAKDPLVKVPLDITDLGPVIEGNFVGTEAVLSIPSTGPDGKPVYKPVARAPLAKSSRQLFLLIPTVGAGKLPYELRTFDDDTTSVPMGSVRVINISPFALRMSMGGVKLPPVPKQQAAAFPCTAKLDAYDMYQGLIEFQNTAGQWIVSHSSSFKASTQKRDIVIGLIDPTTKMPTIRSFSDIPPWLTAQ